MRPVKRTRTRSDIIQTSTGPTNAQTYWYPSMSLRTSDFLYTGHGINYNGTYFETIEDVHGNKEGVNPLYHLTVAMHDMKPMHDYVQDIGSEELVHWTKPVYWPFLAESNLLALVPYPSQGTLDEFFDGCFSTFHEQIPLNVSLLNFLWELREVQDLIPKLSRSITRSAAGGFLWFKFGIKPFLSDLKKLINIRDTVLDRLAWLQQSRGRSVRLGYSSKFEPSKYVYHPNINRSDGNVVRAELEYSSCLLRAGGFLTHHLEGLDDTFSELKAISAALGLNNPAAVVWEAIPYSFVLDWFGRFQELIAKLALQPFAGDFNVHDITWSIKFDARYVIKQYFKSSAGNPAQPLTLGTIELKRYERNTGIPVPSSLITTTSLNSTQQLLALALIRQRLPKQLAGLL